MSEEYDVRPSFKFEGEDLANQVDDLDLTPHDIAVAVLLAVSSADHLYAYQKAMAYYRETRGYCSIKCRGFGVLVQELHQFYHKWNSIQFLLRLVQQLIRALHLPIKDFSEEYESLVCI